MEKKYFYLKLNPLRATFMQDMNAEEKAIMLAHVDYWKPHVHSGLVLVMGPVSDPAGGFGIAVVGVDSEEELMQIIQEDPGAKINRYEVHPMRVVSPLLLPSKNS